MEAKEKLHMEYLNIDFNLLKNPENLINPS